jgi:hypothetical protein
VCVCVRARARLSPPSRGPKLLIPSLPMAGIRQVDRWDDCPAAVLASRLLMLLRSPPGPPPLASCLGLRPSALCCSVGSIWDLLVKLPARQARVISSVDGATGWISRLESEQRGRRVSRYWDTLRASHRLWEGHL